MTLWRFLGILAALFFPLCPCWAQAAPPDNNDGADLSVTEPAISPVKLLQRIGQDEKRIWLFPVTAAHGKGWIPALAVVGVTAGLVALDTSDTPVFNKPSYQQNSVVHGIGHVLSGNTTGLAIAAVPVSFYLGGLIAKDSYSKNTALLAAEAVVNTEIATIAIKDITRRSRPFDVAPGGDFSDTFFQSKDRSAGGFGSFPSGHASAAFAVATVFAERYHSHKWAPWAAYGLASVVALSRLNLQAHFPSDIFFGAALGYSISHFVVLRRHDRRP